MQRHNESLNKRPADGAEQASSNKRGRPRRSPRDIENAFWSHIDRRSPNECWPWVGRSWNGERDASYGMAAGPDGRQMGAHRAAFWFASGRPPGAGMVIRHTCDCRPCCNPAHLIEGTQADNSRDAAERGRLKTKLAPQQVASIYAAAGTLREIGHQFGVSLEMVRKIKAGESWAHLGLAEVAGA